MILSLKNVSFKYSDKPILDGVDFVVNEKEKWGIVGVNGSGKSTLLKILSLSEKADSGEVIFLKKYHLSYCPQETAFAEGYTVYQTVERQMQEDTEKYQIRTILNKLGISNYDDDISTLSGGQQKRVALAITLIRNADLYLLDEPTNHLDQSMILWLEDYLSKSNKAIVMVTHDRYFLSRITDHIVELADGKLYSYQGNYGDYLEQREIRYQQALASQEKRKNFLRREINWIRAGCPARSTKSKARIDNYERIAAIKDVEVRENVTLKSASTRLGKKIIEMEHISKSIDGKLLFDDFSYNLLRDDRIGIIGDNGCGKTTLLNVICGKDIPDGGIVNIGDTVRIGYFAQHNIIFEENERIIDFLKEYGEIVETADGDRITASQMLESFLFPKEMHYLPVGKLSGGEKRRLYLCCILMSSPNVLLMDEPTNDFDTDTLTVLENYIQDFSGPVIVVSHDRYFLDKICDKLFAFRDGRINISLDSYSEYILSSIATERKEEVKEPKKIDKGHNSVLPTSKEKGEFRKLQNDIPILEEEIKQLEEMLSTITDYQKIYEISSTLESKRTLLEEKSERWMELAEKFEI